MYETKYHADGTVTVWNCLINQWQTLSAISDELSATLNDEERAKIAAHLGDIGKTLKPVEQ